MSELEWESRLRELLTEVNSESERSAFLAALQSTARRLQKQMAEELPKPDVPMRFGMVGESPAMLAMFDVLERVAPTDVSVLVTGPTGAGKELVAKALHAHSPRRDKPFLAENCAAVPANLLESELFGHKKGSFTGAVKDRMGHFQAAEGGTLFLDEIGDMPLEMQAKLLRALEERRVRPVGGNKSVPIDIRLVAATHRDLAKASESGAFRTDLYYRLNVITIELPALKDRPSDIPHLARFLLHQSCVSLGKSAEWSPGALEALGEHSWPGNVRELNNVIQRAVALTSGIINAEDIQPALTP